MIEIVRCHRTITGVALLFLLLPLHAEAAFLYHLQLLRGSVTASTSSTSQHTSSSSSRSVRARPNAKSTSRSPRRALRASSSSSEGRIAAIRRRREVLTAVSPAVEQELELVFALVNNEREKHNLTPLRRNRRLDVAAQMHAQDMADRQYFDHASPEGELFDVRIRRAGYPEVTSDSCRCSIGVQYAENIALGQPTAARVVQAWMDSPLHRENILDPTFEDVGYGKVGAYWVQEFGKTTLHYAVAPKAKP